MFPIRHILGCPHAVLLPDLLMPMTWLATYVWLVGHNTNTWEVSFVWTSRHVPYQVDVNSQQVQESHFRDRGFGAVPPVLEGVQAGSVWTQPVATRGVCK
jgi:hypothetical protein